MRIYFVILVYFFQALFWGGLALEIWYFNRKKRYGISARIEILRRVILGILTLGWFCAILAIAPPILPAYIFADVIMGGLFLFLSIFSFYKAIIVARKKVI